MYNTIEVTGIKYCDSQFFAKESEMKFPTFAGS